MPLSLFNAKVSNFGVNLVFFLTYVENLLMPLSLFNANISNLGVNLVLFLKFLIWWHHLTKTSIKNIIIFTVFNMFSGLLYLHMFPTTDITKLNLFLYSFLLYSIYVHSKISHFSTSKTFSISILLQNFGSQIWNSNFFCSYKSFPQISFFLHTIYPFFSFFFSLHLYISSFSSSLCILNSNI
jgi:hypothetical protein